MFGRFGVWDDLQGQGACHAQDRDSTKKDHVASMILLLKRSGANFSVEDPQQPTVFQLLFDGVWWPPLKALTVWIRPLQYIERYCVTLV